MPGGGGGGGSKGRDAGGSAGGGGLLSKGGGAGAAATRIDERKRRSEAFALIPGHVPQRLRREIATHPTRDAAVERLLGSHSPRRLLGRELLRLPRRLGRSRLGRLLTRRPLRCRLLRRRLPGLLLRLVNLVQLCCLLPQGGIADHLRGGLFGFARIPSGREALGESRRLRLHGCGRGDSRRAAHREGSRRRRRRQCLMKWPRLLRCR